MVSLTSSSAIPTPSAVNCATADFTRFPTQDIACAVGSTQGVPSNTTDVLKKCCKTAPVDTFNGQCGAYCLSIQQSVADLQKCFQDSGVKPANIFCNGNNTASASGTPRSMATPTTSRSATGPAQATGAAVRLGGDMGVSKAALGMFGMIVVSALAGVML